MIGVFVRFRSYLVPYRHALSLGSLLAVVEVILHLAHPWPLTLVIDRVLTSAVSDGRAPEHANRFIALAVTAHVVLVGLTALVDYWSTRLLSSAGLHIGNELRSSTFERLQRLSLNYHGRHRVGDLSTRVTSDVDRTQDMMVQALAVLLPNGLLLIAMFIVMVVIDPWFTLLAVLATPPMAFSVHRSTTALKRSSRLARRADGAVAAATSETLGGIHVVQAFTAERQVTERFASLTTSSLHAGLESTRLQARFSPTVDLASATSTAIVLWFGAQRVLNNKMSIGVLLVFLSYLGSLYKPLKALAKLGTVTSKGVAAAERVAEVLDTEPEVSDHPNARVAPRLRGGIGLHDVSFSYGREPVLDGLWLDIHPGETVALVGPTGAGKSTIASLVARFADPHRGVVELDGINVQSFTLRSLRSQIATVLQDSLLLSGTLRENIALGHPRATDAAIERAARLALVDEFSSRLTQGLDTRIGERGVDLSGGQRQRIAIARAIMRDAPILILDEPTSALDAASEELLMAALNNLPTGRTTLVIAHRLATVHRADRICVIDHGRVVEHGSPSDLITSDGRYASLARIQRLVTT
jgi:ATP-binding cassette, subfamily B, bacterial